MVVTVGESIQRVQSLYSRGVQSISSRLSSRHIYSALTSGRSTLLRQQFNKNQYISSWSYQTLPCVELIKAPLTECPCAPRAGCVILRSKHPLPKTITGISKTLIRSVTTIDGSIVFTETSFDTMKYSDKGNKYTKTGPQYFIRNTYLYITVITELKAVSVTGLFEDPLVASTYPTACDDCVDCGCDCTDVMDQDFFISRDQLTPLVQLANQELIVIMKQMQEDKLNNASEDDSSTGMVHTQNPNQEQQ